MTTSKAKRLQVFLAVIVVSILGLEVFSFLVGQVLISSWKMFESPKPIAGVELDSSFPFARDPDVGWPSPHEYGSAAIDRTGSRPSPTFPDSTKYPSCVSFYGDSLMQGGEIADDEVLSDLLSRRFKCRVANYAMGGYGTDQSMIRFLRNSREDPAIVVLGFGSENIMRNLTRNRDLLGYKAWGALKPRYVLSIEGELQLIPIPKLNLEEYRRNIWLANPPLILEHENFHPGGRAGAVRLEFPYSIAILKNLGDFRMKAYFAGEPPWQQFFSPDHPLKGLQITVEIMKHFAAVAKERGQIPLILLFPIPGDFEYFEKTGRWPTQPLVDMLKVEGVDALWLGPFFNGNLDGRTYQELFVPTGGGHFNAAAHVLIANWLKARFQQLAPGKFPPI
jgi:hypothetical protein